MVQVEAPVLQRNSELIEGFIDSLGVLSVGRKRKYRFVLGKVAREWGVGFEGVSRRDLQGLVEEINASELEAWTKRDYRLFLKKFFGWLRDKEFVAFIRLGHVKGRVGPEDILAEDDLPGGFVGVGSEAVVLGLQLRGVLHLRVARDKGLYSGRR